MSCRSAAVQTARSRVKIRRDMELDMVVRPARMRSCFFSVNLRSKSGAPLVGEPKQFLVWFSNVPTPEPHFLDPETNTMPTYMCKCGATVARDANYCPSCRRSLGGIQCKSCGFVGNESHFAHDTCPRCRELQASFQVRQDAGLFVFWTTVRGALGGALAGIFISCLVCLFWMGQFPGNDNKSYTTMNIGIWGGGIIVGILAHRYAKRKVQRQRE